MEAPRVGTSQNNSGEFAVFHRRCAGEMPTQQLRPPLPRCDYMATKRNSLVANINRRKRKGISRPKSKTTVSKRSYKQMQKGWPSAGKKRGRKKAGKKRASKRR
jgi:hypothetical protein